MLSFLDGDFSGVEIGSVNTGRSNAVGFTDSILLTRELVADVCDPRDYRVEYSIGFASSLKSHF